MNFAFLSNYFNHHQKPFCEAMYKRLGDDFCFIATSKVSEWRKKLGYKEMSAKYVLDYSEGLDDFINNCDILVIGSAPYSLVQKRIKSGKLTFFYMERMYKKGIPWLKLPKHALDNYLRFGKYKNVYLLCASAYTAFDFSLTHCFTNRCYKWGYFPETKEYNNIEELIASKSEKTGLKRSGASILWVGRLIGWKHPESMLYLANRLKSENIDFHIDIIGTGDLDTWLCEQIRAEGLGDCITLLGAVSATEVRKHMEDASIFVFTSDKNEGWGAVLNESMNAACAVVASDAIGSVPFLIKEGENGTVFHSGDWEDMYIKVKQLVENLDKCHQMSINAYQTIVNQWNADTAAENLFTLIDELKKGNAEAIKEGPCSKAPVIKG